MWTQLNSITILTSHASHAQINNTVGTVLHIQENKNVKRCRDGMPKSMQNKVGMMHESKGQRIGKAQSLHLFHTKTTPCTYTFMTLHKSVLTVAL